MPSTNRRPYPAGGLGVDLLIRQGWHHAVDDLGAHHMVGPGDLLQRAAQESGARTMRDRDFEREYLGHWPPANLSGIYDADAYLPQGEDQ